MVIKQQNVFETLFVVKGVETINNAVRNISSAFRRLKFKAGSTIKNNLSLIGGEVEDLGRESTNAQRRVDAAFGAMKFRVDNFKRSVEEAGGVIKLIRGRLQKLQRSTISVSLSLIFFGLFLQRIFFGIVKSAVTAFREISNSSNAMAQGLARLEAAWTFIKFVVGNAIATALLPLIPAIVDIVQKIADWVNANPELTAKIILWGAAIGAIIFLLGTLSNGIVGILSLFTNPLFIGFTLFLTGAAILLHSMGNETESVTDRIGDLTLAIGLLVLGVGLAFLSLPIILAGAFILLIAFLIIFRKRVALNFKILFKIIEIKALEWSSSLHKIFTDVARTILKTINKIISSLNKVLGTLGLKKLQKIKFDFFFDSLFERGVKNQEKLRDLGNELEKLTEQRDELSFGNVIRDKFSLGNLFGAKTPGEDIAEGAQELSNAADQTKDAANKLNEAQQNIEDAKATGFGTGDTINNIDNVAVTIPVDPTDDAVNVAEKLLDGLNQTLVGIGG